MDLLIVKLKGRFAHFRKFYTNSSSLSYSIPPRTTLAGILAAILGYERNSYYKIFSKDNLKISLKVDKNTRKIVESVNYIKATSPKAILEPSEHTQIPIEIVTGNDGVQYTLFISHKSKKLMDELEDRVKNNKYVYAPYLGSAPFNCVLNFVNRVEVEESEALEELEIATPIDSKHIVEGSLNLLEGSFKFLKERMPVEFKEGREISNNAAYIYEESGKPIKLKIKSKYVEVGKENIVFM